MSHTPTNSPNIFTELDLKATLRNLDYTSGDTSSTKVANPNIIYPGMIVRVFPHQNRRNIAIERVAAAPRGVTAGTDGVNTKGEFFSDLALPVHIRTGQAATAALTTAQTTEIEDFTKESTGGTTAGLGTGASKFRATITGLVGFGVSAASQIYALPTFAVCSEASQAQNSSGAFVNAVLPGKEGVFTARGLCNLTMNVGAAATSTVGLATSNAYPAGAIVFLDASDSLLPKIVPVDETGTLIASQALLAVGDIIVGYLARRIGSAEFTSTTAQVPVFFSGIPLAGGYLNVG